MLGGTVFGIRDDIGWRLSGQRRGACRPGQPAEALVVLVALGVSSHDTLRELFAQPSSGWNLITVKMTPVTGLRTFSTPSVLALWTGFLNAQAEQ
ncbi:MAG: hypothetical protein U1F00_02370 [Rhodoferax sp.]